MTDKEKLKSIIKQMTGSAYSLLTQYANANKSSNRPEAYTAGFKEAANMYLILCYDTVTHIGIENFDFSQKDIQAMNDLMEFIKPIKQETIFRIKEQLTTQPHQRERLKDLKGWNDKQVDDYIRSMN
jgi:hypothetical protein